MKPKDILKAPKVVTDAGSWKVVTGKAGKMAATAFPLSRKHAIQLGRNWHWRVDQVEASGQSMRILTAYNPDVEEYRSWLGLPRGEGHVVIGQLEFHGTHPGWHCHVSCCEVDEIEPGHAHPRTAARFPAGTSNHRRAEFVVSESSALAAAFEFFNVTGTPAGSMI